MTKRDKVGFYGSLKIILRTFSFMEKYRKFYLIGWLFTSAEIIMAFVTPYLYQQLVQIITHDKGQDTIQTVIELFVVLLALTPLVCLGVYLQQTSSIRGIGVLRKHVFNHIQQLTVSESMERKTGDYISRMTNDVDRAGGMFQSYAITGLSKFILYFIFSTVILFQTNWKLALISLFLCIMSFFLSTILNPRIRILEHKARESSSSSASYLIEALRSLPIVRVFLLKSILSERYYEVCKEIYKKRVTYRSMNGITDALIYFFSFSAQPIGFIVGIMFMVQGEMEISSVVFTSSIMGVMAEGMRNFSVFVQFIQPGIVSSQRVFEMLDQPIENTRKTLHKPDLLSENALIIENLNFTYPNGQKVLKNICFTVRQGENIAIVGGSGGGKTTLFKLLQDFYTADSGDVWLFNSRLQDLSRSEMRSLSAYVPQDCTIFDGTIADNIGLGKPGSSMIDIINAAKQGNIHNFINSLPNGYETTVGERGSQISGGQRQRIAIARAILKDAPLLLLDEATASLDSQSEDEVYKGLDSLMRGRTTIVVAHRLSTVKFADRIIVMEGGEIVEEGSHLQLLERDGRYRELYELQFK